MNVTELFEARSKRLRPSAPNADLRDAVLEGADLSYANLRGADLRYASLSYTDLRGADLSGANLAGADLRGADLRVRASLRGADLWDANLSGADLRGADLWGANLEGVNLQGANLWGALWDGLAFQGLPSGDALLIPTPDGWRVRVGCWAGTIDELAEMVAGDEWPEARGKEIARRRPGLEAWIAQCRAHIAANPNVVPDLAEKWGNR